MFTKNIGVDSAPNFENLQINEMEKWTNYELGFSKHKIKKLQKQIG